MDTCEAMRFYVDRMLDTGDNNGMKVLLFDDETLKMIGLVYSRHRILERGVFLHDNLASTHRQKKAFLLGIVFVRPTAKNFQLLKNELENPKCVALRELELREGWRRRTVAVWRSLLLPRQHARTATHPLWLSPS
jgi:hypothetical protein